MGELTQSRQTPIVWSIGGVDPTALAGISADNRAIAVSGAHGVNVITCLSAQNSNAFLAKQATSLAFLDQQWCALAEQCPPCVIKVGMLVNVEQVNWLSEKLANLKKNSDVAPWVIYDPVLRASSEATPIQRKMMRAISEQLMPLVDLITPNVHEAMALSNMVLPSADATTGMAKYAKLLSQQFNTQVLLKGGHVSDIYAEQSNESYTDFYARVPTLDTTRYRCEPCTKFSMTQPSTQCDHRRGSGCILASLIAGFVANDYTFCDAIIFSAGVMQKAYRDAQPLGNSAGGALRLTSDIKFTDLAHINQFNEVAPPALSNEGFEPCPKHLGLYPVVDSVPWLERLLSVGVKTIQLRVKDYALSDAEPLIIDAIALGKQYHARVFINDYWQLAIKHGAYGVHLGQEDMVGANLQRIKQSGLRLGLSTHGLFEAQWASQFRPSYMAIGHIFATQTKDMASRPQGLEKLNRQVKLFRDKLPLVAIGGISVNRFDSVLDSDIASIAVVSAITNAINPDEVTKSLLSLLGEGEAHEQLETV